MLSRRRALLDYSLQATCLVGGGLEAVHACDRQSRKRCGAHAPQASGFLRVGSWQWQLRSSRVASCELRCELVGGVSC